MKIWFDISNSPHINLFAGLIRDLEKEHRVIITSRPLANTVDLLRLYNFSFEVVGRHYGASKLKKAAGYPVRIYQLYRYLQPLRPDVAISQSSFHSPLVSRLLGIPSIYMNDNEHAMGNVPSFICANKIMIPEYLERKRVYRQGARDKKIVQYPGVKEGIYLWNLAELQGKDRAEGKAAKERKVYVRPEPWTAQYYRGKVNFMDSLLVGLREKLRVVLLPRDEAQGTYYKRSEFKGIEVSQKALGLSDIAQDCSLFVGAGGTMTREMAVLGIPTISVYQSALLNVDQHLIRLGQMIHKPDLDAKSALAYLQNCERRPPSDELLAKGRQAYNLIKSELCGALAQGR